MRPISEMRKLSKSDVTDAIVFSASRRGYGRILSRRGVTCRQARVVNQSKVILAPKERRRLHTSCCVRASVCLFFFFFVPFVLSSVFVVLISADDTWKRFYAKNSTEYTFKQRFGFSTEHWNVSFFVIQKYFMMQ